MHWSFLPLVATAVSPASIQETGQTRNEKFLSIFEIVRFNNEQCETEDGNRGTCFSAADCRNPEKGSGEAKGTCASGFGVCCYSKIDSCVNGQIVKLPLVNIQSPGFPSGIQTSAGDSCSTSRQATDSSPQSYSYIIGKYSSNVVQFKVEFMTTELSGPYLGDCTNDTLLITGADPNSNRMIPNLCGILTGQHFYVNARTVDDFTITINLSATLNQKWHILISAIESTNSEMLAPNGCLQYYTSFSDTISSFNNDDGNGELLNNQMYSICLKEDNKYCDVGLSQNNFDLEGSSGVCEDSVTFGYKQFCGSSLATNTWNYTGPYLITVMSDDSNSGMKVGFNINYVLLPC